MAETKIEWTDYTVNPIRARDKATGKVGHYCEKVSPGCQHCYASAMQRRFGTPEFGGHRKLPVLPLVGDNGSVSVSDRLEVFLDETKLEEVLRRKKPSKIFWADMTDLFGAWVPDEWIDRCFAMMALTPRHTHQVLTKRPDRMLEYVRGLSKAYHRLEIARSLGYALSFENLPLVPWPIASVWLGVSVENQATADERIPLFLQTPAVVRFLSCEPLLGAIEFSDVSRRSDAVGQMGKRALNGIDWVIIGGESGPKARPCELAWIRSLIEQCKAGSVPCFTKQLGSHVVCRNDEVSEWFDRSSLWLSETERFQGATGRVLGFRDPKAGDPAEWPADLRIRQFPAVDQPASTRYTE